MTMLTGRPNNFVRIPESQYQADIAAAEERGRASVAIPTVAATPATPTATAATSPTPQPSLPTEEQEAAMAEVKRLNAARAAEVANDPEVIAAKLRAYVAGEAGKGRKISLSQASAEIANEK